MVSFEAFIRSGLFWTGTWDDVATAQREGVIGPWAPRALQLVLYTRHARLLELTTRLSQALGDVPHVVLKGLSAGAAWRHPALRPQSDLDVLVAPADVPSALLRWRRAELIGADVHEHGHGFHVRLTSPLLPGVPIELHHGLTQNFALRVDVAELLSRRREIELEGQRLPVLALPDEVTYLALHAATHAGEKLRWFFDLREKVAGFAAWDDVVARALAWNVPWPVWWALRQATERVGAHVPASVLTALAPPASARARIALVERLAVESADSLAAKALRLSLTPLPTVPGIVAGKLSARLRSPRRWRG